MSRLTGRRASALAATLTALLIGSTAHASDRGAIRFGAGRSGAEVTGGVVRGDRDLWRVAARKGQRLQLTITSPERNAVVAIYTPGATASKGEDGWEVKGRSLPRAGETDDAPRWSGVLPATGDYLIVVGGTRGDADYHLKIQVR